MQIQTNTNANTDKYIYNHPTSNRRMDSSHLTEGAKPNATFLVINCVPANFCDGDGEDHDNYDHDNDNDDTAQFDELPCSDGIGGSRVFEG